MELFGRVVSPKELQSHNETRVLILIIWAFKEAGLALSSFFLSSPPAEALQDPKQKLYQVRRGCQTERQILIFRFVVLHLQGMQGLE